MSHKYHTLWKCEVYPEGIEADEVPEGWGGGDAVIFMSLLYPSDGSFSMMFFPIDGREETPDGNPVNDSLDVDEVFKSWWMMASALSGRTDLSPGKRRFCEAVFTSYVELAGLRPGSEPERKPS